MRMYVWGTSKSWWGKYMLWYAHANNPTSAHLVMQGEKPGEIPSDVLVQWSIWCCPIVVSIRPGLVHSVTDYSKRTAPRSVNYCPFRLSVRPSLVP